jgi:predicted aspartyl protease
MPHRRAALLLWLAVAVLALPVAAVAQCRVVKRQDVKLEMVLNHLFTTLQVNGTDAEFMVDTGAMRTLVTDDTVARLGLKLDQWRSTMMQGVGGYSRKRDAVLDSFTVQGMPLRRFGSNPDIDVAVGVIGEPVVNGHRIAGILGVDYLSSYDIDLDVRGRRMALYDVSGCSGRFIPWQGAYQRVPLELAPNRLVMMRAMLEGRPINAALDSGADNSAVSSVAAARIGVTPEVLSRDPGSFGTGVGAQRVPVHRHRFTQLRLGDGVFDNTTLMVLDLPTGPFDMLVGLDFLTTRRVWISYATAQVFFQ